MAYKIVYHTGDEIGMKTRGLSGKAAVTDDALMVEGASHIVIPFNDIKSVGVFRLHGLLRAIELIHRGGTLFMIVVRLNVRGYFVIGNYLGTGELFHRLEAARQGNARA